MDNDCEPATEDAPDTDGDGSTVCEDCDDSDPALLPGALELPCDGVDNDCDPGTLDGPDADGDGITVCDDCDDGDAEVYPGAPERCNGIDDDCDPATDEEVDGDGDGTSVCGGDCDDTDPAVLPGVGEICNGIDDDCDPATDEQGDGDGDGLTICDGDCDDGDPTVFPGAPELCDGADNDCNALVDEYVTLDLDGDGYSPCLGDCDDGDAASYPGAEEVLCDGQDNDCDPGTEDAPDEDGDGAPVCGDCDDLDPGAFPGGTEVPCDGIDNDCDPGTPDSMDADGDGWEDCVDCDDGDPDLNLDDGDGDGWSPCDGDCDDGDADVSPGLAEVLDGRDNDCDGLYDEGVLAAGDLLITEVMQNPDAVDDADGEWIELFNATGVELNLVGLRLSDLGADVFEVTGDLWLPAGEYLVLGLNGDPAVNGGAPVQAVYTNFFLANGDDEVVVEHGGVELDAVEYDVAFGWPQPVGASMSLDPDAHDPLLNDDPAAWCEGVDPYGLGDLGSPGGDNPVCGP